MQQNKEYLLALLETTNLTFSLSTKLLELCPNLADLFNKSAAQLIHMGIKPQEAQKLIKPDWGAVEVSLKWAQNSNNYIITIQDPEYPQLLKEIPNPPLLLFVQGNLAALKAMQLAIVGSRNPTYYGRESAFILAKELAQAGLAITSGFATGIDAASHNGAMAGLGQTLAIMGTGLNQLYPAKHQKLAEQILANNGALVSEFNLEAKGSVWRFPLRNRIISGLSIGTLVVEATMRSGSLISARLANEQGREVFAIPGSIYNPLSCGCHYLINQGAKLVTTSKDIADEFGILTNPILSRRDVSPRDPEKPKLSPDCSKLLACIGFEITTIDELVTRIDFSVAQISAILLELELNDLVKSCAGGYVKI
jgi:DNA processing protein